MDFGFARVMWHVAPFLEVLLLSIGVNLHLACVAKAEQVLDFRIDVGELFRLNAEAIAASDVRV